MHATMCCRSSIHTVTGDVIEKAHFQLAHAHVKDRLAPCTTSGSRVSGAFLIYSLSLSGDPSLSLL